MVRKNGHSGKVFARGVWFRISQGEGAFLGSPVQHSGYRGMTETAALNSSPAALWTLLVVPGDRGACLLLTQDLSWNIGSSSPSACRLWNSLGLEAPMTPSTCRHPEATTIAGL